MHTAYPVNKAALAGKVGGRLVDTSFRLADDAALEIVTDKHPDALEVLRHSTAHLLAQAVQSLFPDAQVTIGPVIEDGFYYDVYLNRTLGPEDLQVIEKRMREKVRQGLGFERSELAMGDATDLFGTMKQDFKVEQIGRAHV